MLSWGKLLEEDGTGYDQDGNVKIRDRIRQSEATVIAKSARKRITKVVEGGIRYSIGDI